jgi:hypothetical protein
VQVLSAQSLADRAVVNPTCRPGNGSTKLGGSRMQAARLSPEICIVVDRRIIPMCRGKVDAFHAAEDSSLNDDMASDCDTTGVLDRGMHSKG